MGQLSTTQTPLRVAVVDDSRTIRRWLRHLLNADPRLTVVAEAGSGSEAREILRSVKVDVVTLDVHMPGMSGIDFLGRLMRHRPMPVVMLSALAEEGSAVAVQALSLGAVDCIEKPKTALDITATTDICDRVYRAGQVHVDALKTRSSAFPALPVGRTEACWRGGLILLGASTGGVTALETLLGELDGIPWPVVIAQHMPENFLRSFSRRLNDRFARNFYVASDGHVLKSGQGVLALGKTVSTRLVRTGDGMVRCSFGPPSEDARFRPCVDDLFLSAAQAGFNGVAAVLTGMGNDGARGLKALRDAGFYTVGQSQESCVVYGMPRAAAALGAVVTELSDHQIGARFAEITQGVDVLDPLRVR